jgi:DnaK suppressor protein
MAVELTRKSFTPYAAKKGEEYMNARQRTHFRKILESLKAELSEEIDRTVHTMQDEATVFADPNDRASQESDMALELRNRDRERKLIKKIDETIARIDANEYGYCESCGVEIGLKRLEARPTATLCIDCKTLDELRERQVAKSPCRRSRKTCPTLGAACRRTSCCGSTCRSAMPRRRRARMR